MSDDFDDDLDKARNANKEVRRAVREGNLKIGMDADQKVNTVLTHLERYEKGLMGRIENDIRELEDALRSFRKDIGMEKDELHKMDDSIGRWNRITLYLDFLEDKIQELEQERREKAERMSGSEDEEDSEDVDVPSELDINLDNLRAGREPFALEGLDLSDIKFNTYGLRAVVDDLNFIMAKSLGPVAGEIEDEKNLLYKGLNEIVEAMEEAAESHNHLLEVKEILRQAEDDDELLKKLEDENANSRVEEQINRTLKGTKKVDNEFNHLLSKERDLIELIREAHELVRHQIDLDQEFLSNVDNELGNSKWWGFRKTGLYKKLENMRGKSGNLDNELDKMVENLDEIRTVLDNVRERKQKQETREEEILSKVESYLDEYSEMMESS